MKPLFVTKSIELAILDDKGIIAKTFTLERHGDKVRVVNAFGDIVTSYPAENIVTKGEVMARLILGIMYPFITPTQREVSAMVNKLTLLAWKS